MIIKKRERERESRLVGKWYSLTIIAMFEQSLKANPGWVTRKNVKSIEYILSAYSERCYSCVHVCSKLMYLLLQAGVNLVQKPENRKMCLTW